MYKRLQNITVSQKKLWILGLTGIFFIVALSLTLNRVTFIRLKSDLFLRWYSTEKLFEEGRNLYDERNGEEINDIVYGDNPARKTNFYYPAFLIVLTGPLSVLSYQVAHFMWTTAVQLFYLIGLWLVIREVGWPQQVNQITVFMAACVICVPYFQHTIWGQFNTIGVLSLSGCWLLLRRNKFGLAGVSATGMLIKPHGSILALCFLFIWAVSQKKRWPFLAGFATASFILWFIAELVQPGWVFDFINALGGYVPVNSVVDQWWNPNQVLSIILTLGTVLLFIYLRNSNAVSPQFEVCLGISLYVWALVVPILGMFHILMLPVTIIMLLSRLQQSDPKLYKIALLCFGIIFILGWVGFVVGLSSADLYGSHIRWSEMAYNAVLPVASIILSLLLLRNRNTHQSQAVLNVS